jgi:type II secretory pathway component PulF
MPTFSYRALQADGKFAEGMLDAAGRPDALRQIEILGLRPVKVTEKAGAKNAAKNGAPAKAANGEAGASSLNLSSFKFESKKVSAKELENFTRLLSSLLAAGVPLSRALVILQKETTNTAAKAKWKEIHDAVVDGLSLSDSMAKAPETFPGVYVAMVEAGEAGGFLDVVLAQIAEFQAREKEMKAKVLTAMLYPAILAVLGVGILIMLLTFFIPKFQGIFNNLHTSLPLITQIIIGASHLVRSYGLLVAAGLVGMVFALRAWFVSAKGRRMWEGMILKTPLVGPLIAQFAMARFCRMLGTLLGAGVALVQGLNVARRSIGNQILVDAVGQSIERVQQGNRLGQSLADCRILFSGSTIEMISVAEESGRLDGELVRLANGTENDLDRNLKTAVALAEPLLLFLIAGFIGTIFIGMLLPVLTMSQNIH